MEALSKDNYLPFAIDNLKRRPIMVNDLASVLLLPTQLGQSLEEGNVRAAINSAVTFFNTFLPSAATELYLLLAETENGSKARSVLNAIGAAQLPDHDVELYKRLIKEINP
jgi:hypothetical protein